jgi:hypothetical protein
MRGAWITPIDISAAVFVTAWDRIVSAAVVNAWCLERQTPTGKAHRSS